MDINDRLFVEIHPLEAERVPRPHPLEDAHFDPAYIYKVLGMYNPSETSECYFALANTKREIWFIPQRHLLAYKLIDSDEFFLPKATPSDSNVTMQTSMSIRSASRTRPASAPPGREIR
jgi:hypothetical protein